MVNKAEMSGTLCPPLSQVWRAFELTSPESVRVVVLDKTHITVPAKPMDWHSVSLPLPKPCRPPCETCSRNARVIWDWLPTDRWICRTGLRKES